MPDSPSEPVQPGRRKAGRRALLRVLLGLAILIALLAGAAMALYAGRRAVAQQLLAGWLERRGVETEAVIERLELDGLAGRIRLGGSEDPELSIGRIEAAYTITPPWSAGGFGVTLGQVRLLRPVLKASWRDGRLSLGSLDPLIQELTASPTDPSVRGPAIIVEAGELQLDTAQGRLQLLADARLEDRRLLQLTAQMPGTARVAAGGVEARGLHGTLDLRTSGERVAIRMQAAAERLSSPLAQGEQARLTLTGELPYPDIATRRADGAWVLQADLGAASLQAEAGQMREVRSQLTFDGELAGDVAALRVNGEGGLELMAAAITQPRFLAEQVRATLADARMELRRNGERLEWNLKSRATVASNRLQSGELSLREVRAAVDLDAADGGSAGMPRILAAASLEAARGAWPLLGAPAAEDAPELAGMKRALQSFSIRAPGLQLRADSAGTSVALTRAARIAPANGGALAFAPLARPAYQAGRGARATGAVRVVATRGGGLPEGSITVPAWHLTETGFEAELDARAALDFAPAHGVQLGSRGRLVLAGEQLTYTARDCIAITVERVELEENDLTGISGALCPERAPLLVAGNDTWKMQGVFNAVSAQVPSLAVGVSGAQGQILAQGSARGAGVEMALTAGQIVDATQPARFNPLAVTGSAALAGGRWTGALGLASQGQNLGRVTLAHDAASGAGGVHIEVPELRFAEPGLQPAELSALAGAYVQSPASGSIRFDGRIDWTGEATTSSGRLSIPGLDFTSPAGAVKGLKGEIDFTSLLPLVTAPAQSLLVEQLVTATEVTGLNLVFALDAASLQIAGGEVSAAGGRIRATPFALPLDLSQPFNGTIVLESVDLGKVLADAGLAERVVLDAVVSGRLPFVWSPGQGLRVVGGSLAAVQPGRVTVRREVLADVQSSGSGQVPPGLVEDLAYQAMENLAFDTLSAEVNSLDGGRMGVVFRIKGRHDPPQRQQLRVGLMELISRRFLQRNLPLPSDTQIDLTLDTTLNLNQLLSDLLAVNRARNGQPAAPAGP